MKKILVYFHKRKYQIIAVIMLSTPIIAYFCRFGVGFWSEHEEWAHLGSFFGGVLGPMVTLLSVVYLSLQLKLQNLEFVTRQNESLEREVTRQNESLEREVKEAELLFSTYLEENNFDEIISTEYERYKNINDEEKKKQANLFLKNNRKVLNLFLLLEEALINLYERDYQRYQKFKKNMIGLIDIESYAKLNNIVSFKVGEQKTAALNFK